MSLTHTEPVQRLIYTGPLQSVPDWGELIPQRGEALWDLGAPKGRGVRYIFPTASVIWDGPAKRIYVAVNPDVHDEDWLEVCKILRMVGWMIGDPRYDDIGEPMFDRVTRVWVWALKCP